MLGVLLLPISRGVGFAVPAEMVANLGGWSVEFFVTRRSEDPVLLSNVKAVGYNASLHVVVISLPSTSESFGLRTPKFRESRRGILSRAMQLYCILHSREVEALMQIR